MVMIVAGEYSVDEFMAAMSTGSGRKAFFNDGKSFKRTSQRMLLFFRDGFSCVDCGLTGNRFALESVREKDTPHLNLYHVSENEFGKNVRILFTKDHILPRARGGHDVMSNYQVMCQICNAKKGNQLENERVKRQIVVD